MQIVFFNDKMVIFILKIAINICFNKKHETVMMYEKHNFLMKNVIFFPIYFIMY